ncbi:MAG: hypothetical protein HYU52_12780 [Acidobacteria bacterium]|nr:hypothetical protein [Acidobacteriota bacterium]
MNARTPLIALLSFLVSLPALSQCVWTPVFDGAYRATALDAAVDGNDLWVATSWGLELYDASFDPPYPITTIPLGGTTSAVAAAGGKVYVGSGAKFLVMSKSGGSIVTIGSTSLGGTVSDLLVLGPYVFAATSGGVAQIDVAVADNPALVRTLSTTNIGARSLALLGATLYATDGDSTVEAYNVQLPSAPQKLGTFNSLTPSLWVSEASGRLYVSDGQRTEVFIGSGALMTRVATLAAGANAAVAGTGSVVYLVGDDRILRAYEVSQSGTAKLFAGKSTPLGGTVNRYLELLALNGRLHGAAGDAGLASFDARGFTAPFVLRGHALGQMSSAVSLGSSVVSAKPAGGLFKYGVGPAGELTPQTNWDVGSASIVRDGNGSRVLTTSGTRARVWDVSQSPPVEVSSVTLSTTIVSAALNGNGGIAVLADQTAWTLDFSALQGSATKVDLGGAKPSFVERGGSDIAFADLNESGTTTVRFFSGGVLTSAPAIATIEGATTSGLGVSGTGLVAGVTFKGISVVNFGQGGAVSIYPGTNSIIARDVQMSGNNLFVLATATIQYWDASTKTLEREIELDSTSTTVHSTSGSGSAVVATEEGLSTIQYASTSGTPLELAAGTSNRYYRDLFAGDRVLHLFDGRAVTTLPLDSSGMPGLGRELALSGSIVDIAAVGTSLFVLAINGTVTGYSAAGVQTSIYQVDESSDQRMIGMRTVAGALWVTVETNCLSGECELRTLVLDPRTTLAKSATLPGGVAAAAAGGARAWAALSVPAEIRVYDVSDPFHPAALVGRASTGNPVAIAHDAARNAVYAIGQRVYVYTDTQLDGAGTLLDPYVSDPSGRVGYVDQQIHVSGNCALITGRTFSPQLFRINGAASWIAEPLAGSAAAAVRSSAITGGKTYLLSDYSLEVWSSTGSTLVRHRPVR